jgi:3-hydroxy acid dehydrogenase/malonic semialdehyde reductase
MVETEFSLVRFRGDANAAKKVYDGLEPRKYDPLVNPLSDLRSHVVTGHDIAEEIVWAASRPPHINIADVLIYPVNQASAIINYRKPTNL